MSGATHRQLVARRINDTNKPWAVIDQNGDFGDDLVGGYMTESDARLFAAAPDMLQALEDCADRLAGSLDEIRHLRGWLSESEASERATQDDAADERDEEVIARARAAISRARLKQKDAKP